MSLAVVVVVVIAWVVVDVVSICCPKWLVFWLPWHYLFGFKRCVVYLLVNVWTPLTH